MYTINSSATIVSWPATGLCFPNVHSALLFSTKEQNSGEVALKEIAASNCPNVCSSKKQEAAAVYSGKTAVALIFNLQL